MKITFEGETFESVIAHAAEFFNRVHCTTMSKETTEALPAEMTEKPEEKPKRKRRTKVEMEADKQPSEDDPKPRRRRSASKEERPSTKEELVDDGTPPEEITDEDVMKEASAAAKDITPKAVMEILEQFGVVNVGDLTQAQRREFIDQLAGKKTE